MVVSKHEIAAKVKTELPNKGAKQEPQNVKNPKSEILKREVKIKQEVKFQPLKSSVDDLVKRGMALRAKAEVRVKKEQKQKRGAKAERKPKRKRKVTAKRRNASREAMLRPVTLSEELQDLLGEKALSRPETVKRIWAYSKDHNLINPSNKREIICNPKLQSLLGKETVGLLDLQKVLMPHFDYSSPAEQSQSPSKKAKVEVKTKIQSKKEEKIKTDELKSEKIKPEVKQEVLSKEPQDASVSAEIVAKEVAMRLTGLFPTYLTLEVSSKTLYSTRFKFQMVGASKSFDANAKLERKQDFNFSVRETLDGCFESFASVRLEDLEPSLPYSVFLEIREASEPKEPKEPFCTSPISIPQRSDPAKWSPHEVQLWSSSLQVPSPQVAFRFSRMCSRCSDWLC